MLAAIRPMGLSLKIYTVALSAAALASFVAGGTVNFIYAKNHPGADPYLRAPAVQLTPTPAAVPAPVPVAPQADDDSSALVAAAPSPRAVALRRDPMHCVDQVAADGKLLGQLCQRDPGGVAGSAMGAVQR